VRVRVRVVIGVRVFEVIALANTGFETDEPQLLIPYNLLVEKNIDVSDLGKPTLLEYDTPGGSVTMYVYPRACRVSIVEPDRSSREVIADLVVSLTEREVLMSDALIEELGVIIVSPRKGLWKFTDDPSTTTRSSQRIV
jgi:hypothetical protein